MIDASPAATPRNRNGVLCREFIPHVKEQSASPLRISPYVRFGRTAFAGLAELDGNRRNLRDDEMSLGERLVKVPHERGELNTVRLWIVEPLGTPEGTNGFGALVSVPVIQFWEYKDELPVRKKQ